jgi:hypothetical protein
MLNFKRLFSHSFIQKIQENLFYLFIIFLPTQLGKHFWLKESLTKGFRVDYFAPKIYFLDILVIILLLFLSFQKKQKTLKISDFILCFYYLFKSFGQKP